MPMLEIHFPKPANIVTVNNFKSYFFHNASHYDISIQNEDITTDNGTTILYFEISDLDYGNGFNESLKFAYNNIATKHKRNIYIKVFHDSVGEEEFLVMPEKELLKSSSFEDIELHKKPKRTVNKTAVSNYFDKHPIESYAIIRVRIERKKHETLLKKTFESILKTTKLVEKENIFSTTLDMVVKSKETFYTDFSDWRGSMEYKEGNVGQICFLESLVEYHLEKKYLTILLLDTPYERKPYIPFIWGLFGLFGEKTEIKIWSKNPKQTRLLWHYEDNIMGPTKGRAFEIDDWSYDNYKSIECKYYNDIIADNSDIEWVIPDQEEKVQLTPGEILFGKVWKTNRTDSGLIIKDTKYDWPESYDYYDAILEDMTQVERGDSVQIKTVGIDHENKFLICQLIERTPID